MFGLPRDIDLTFLKDKEVQQICIGLYQVIFYLHLETSISVESKFSYQPRDSESPEVWVEGCPVIAWHLPRLLGSSIIDVQVLAKGTLRLKFSNGDELLIYDENDKYESYQITCGQRTIII